MLSKQKPPACQVYYYQYQKLKTKEQRAKDDLMKSRNPRGVWYVDEQSYKQIQKIEVAEKAEQEKRKLNMKVEEERVKGAQLKVKDDRRRRIRLQDEESFQSYKEKYNDLYQEHALMKKKLEDMEKMMKNKDKYINALNKAFKDVFEQKEKLSKKPPQVDVLTQTEHLMIDFGIQCQPEMKSKYIGTERKYFKGREVQTEKVKSREFSCQTKEINTNEAEIGKMQTGISSTCVDISTMTDSSLMETDQTTRLIPIETIDRETMTIDMSPIRLTPRGFIDVSRVAINQSKTGSLLTILPRKVPLITDPCMEKRKGTVALIKDAVKTLQQYHQINNTSTKTDGINTTKVKGFYHGLTITEYYLKMYYPSNAIKTSPIISHSEYHMVRYRSFDLLAVYIYKLFWFKISFNKMKMIFANLIKIIQIYHRQQDIPVAELCITTVFIPNNCYKHQEQIKCLTYVLPQICFDLKINLDDIMDIRRPQKQMKRQEAVYQNINGCMIRKFCLNQRIIKLIRTFLVYVKIIKYQKQILLVNCVGNGVVIEWNVLQIIRVLTYISITIGIDILKHYSSTNLRYNVDGRHLILKSSRYTSNVMINEYVTADALKNIINQQMVTNVNVDKDFMKMIMFRNIYTHGSTQGSLDINKTLNRLNDRPLMQKDFTINKEHYYTNNKNSNFFTAKTNDHQLEILDDPTLIYYEPQSYLNFDKPTSKKSTRFVRLFKCLKTKSRKGKMFHVDDDDDNLRTTHCFTVFKRFLCRKRL